MSTPETTHLMPSLPYLTRLLGRRTRFQEQRGFDNYLITAGFIALVAPLVLIGAALLYRSLLHYQINYNEGWNSYFTSQILQGLPLYPDRSTHLINNYPPLSFYVVAVVSKLTGSVLVAGRIMGWFGYVASAVLIGLILRQMGSNLGGAWFGALFFAAAVATRCDLYVGIFDPQLLGQAVMLAGLFVLLGERGRGGAIGAAALMVAGGFVKHSLIALPLSTTLWLAACRRRLFWSWLVAAVVLAAASLAVCALLFGPEFAAGLTMPRRMDLADGARKVLRWMLPLELPCALATLALTLDGTCPILVGIYLPVSLGAAVIGAAPLATNYNMIFEMLVAVSLGLGLLIGRRGPIPSGWVALAGAASLWITALQLGTASTSSWTIWSTDQRNREAHAVADIAQIRARPGPALCGTLLLCFEAGKPLAYDPLNFGTAPGEDQASLREAIEARRFATIQTDPANLSLASATLNSIAHHYQEIPGHPGLFEPLH